MTLNAPSTMQTQGFPLYAVDTMDPDQVYLVVGWSLGSTVALPVLVPMGGLAMNSAFTGKPDTQWTFTVDMPVKVERRPASVPSVPSLRSIPSLPRYGA